MTATILFFSCASFPFILIGLVWWSIILGFLMRTEETTGRIVSVEISRSGKASKTIAEFQTADGKMIQFVETTGRAGGLFEFLVLFPIIIVRYLFQKVLGTAVADTDDGDRVKILYDPNNPGRAHIKSFHYLHERPLFFIMLGILIGMSAIPAVFSFYSKIGEFLNKFFSWI